jgi:hypothetical protein
MNRIAKLITYAALMPLMGFAFALMTPSVANAATACTLPESRYISKNTPTISSYGSNYSGDPKLVYAGQSITFNFSASARTGYSVKAPSSFSESKTFNRGADDYNTTASFTKDVTVGWRNSSRPWEAEKTCTIKNVKWTTSSIRVYNPQSFGLQFGGAQVTIGGDKKFGGTTTVNFNLQPRNSINMPADSGQPRANGTLYFHLNGFPSVPVYIRNGSGSVTIPNNMMYFNALESGNCNSYFNITSPTNWFGQKCSSLWYDADTSRWAMPDYISNANPENMGMNRVSTLDFISSNRNIWENASNFPIGDPWYWPSQNPIYKWVMAGPEAITNSDILAKASTAGSAGSRIPGVSVKGDQTYLNSSFGTTPSNNLSSSSIAHVMCRTDKNPSCLDSALAMYTWGKTYENLPFKDGLGSRTYVIPNALRQQGTYDTSPLMLSCPANSNGVRVGYLDYGQAIWNEGQYSIMRNNQQYNYQTRAYTDAGNNRTRSIFQSSAIGLTSTWLPFMAAAEYDHVDFLLNNYNRTPYKWGSLPWSCVMPAPASTSSYDIDFRMKITAKDENLSVYTSTQPPILQSLKIYDVNDPTRKVYARNLQIQVWTNTGTNESPRKGSLVTTAPANYGSGGTWTTCNALGGSTLPLPQGKYKLGPNDRLNTCLKDLQLPLIKDSGKYIAVVRWDGFEGEYQAYQAGDSWGTTGAQARFAFEIVEPFSCVFNDATEFISVTYDVNGQQVTNNGTPATITNSGNPMTIRYPNVSNANIKGMLYNEPNIDPALNGIVRAQVAIVSPLISSPKEPSEVRLYNINGLAEIMRDGTNLYKFTFEDIGKLTSSTTVLRPTAATADKFADIIRISWPSTIKNGVRESLTLQREISVYGWAWESGGGQLKKIKGWHTCQDNPKSGAFTVVSSQVNQ